MANYWLKDTNVLYPLHLALFLEVNLFELMGKLYGSGNESLPGNDNEDLVILGCTVFD